MVREIFLQSEGDLWQGFAGALSLLLLLLEVRMGLRAELLSNPWDR